MTDGSARRRAGYPSEKSRRRLLLLRAGILILLLGFIGFWVYQCTGHITVGMTTLRTQEITETSYVRMELYLFRDERPVTADGNVYAYEVTDGEKVSVGQTLAGVYAALEGTDVTALQAELDAYATRLALATAAKGGDTLSDALALSDAVDRTYLDLLAAAKGGGLSSVYGYADRMLDQINRYQAMTGTVQGTAVTPESLKAQREGRLEGMTPVQTLTATEGGYFYYRTDGYETVFDYGAVMTMTADEFTAMTAAAATPAPQGTAGKLVVEPTWYGAAILSPADADLFRDRVGMEYTMTTADGTALRLELMRLSYEGDRALAVFASRSMPDGFGTPRRISVETVSGEISGYRIPAEAVVTLDAPDGGTEMGVYVLSGNVVEFRKIRVLVRYEGYLVAETYEGVQALLESMSEADRETMEADGWPYLQFNDNIITRGTGLYDGKMIG